MEIILGLKVTVDQVKTRKFSFGDFWRFLTSALTLNPRNPYIYVFRAMFGFGNFLGPSCEFWKLRVSSFFFTQHFEWIEWDFWRLHVLLCCWAANQDIEITSIFLRFQTKEPVLRVNKHKINGENAFNGEKFAIDSNHGSSKNKKGFFLGVLGGLWPVL